MVIEMIKALVIYDLSLYIIEKLWNKRHVIINYLIIKVYNKNKPESLSTEDLFFHNLKKSDFE